jgi:hypothetical protein
MNNSKTPKIVVGVGLVAAYAAGLTFLTLRDKPASVEQSPSAVSAQMVAAPAAPPAVIAESDTLASATTTEPAVPETSNAAKVPAAAPPVASQPKPRAAEVPVANLPSPRPPAASDAEESSRSNSGTNAVSELAATANSVASESVTSAEDKSSEDSEGSTEVPAAAVDNQ